jgi:hypothetical protein
VNWYWAFWFKDKIKTPFSVYKMSLAELIVLGGMIFGVGFGVTKGLQWILSLELTGDVVEASEGVLGS